MALMTAVIAPSCKEVSCLNLSISRFKVDSGLLSPEGVFLDWTSWLSFSFDGVFMMQERKFLSLIFMRSGFLSNERA